MHYIGKSNERSQMQQALQPGDRVVDLAGLTQSAGLFGGAIVAAVSAWLAKRSVAWLVSALFIGAVFGFFIGNLVGRVYRSAGDQRSVISVGAQALPSAIPAGLLGAIISALVMSSISVFVLKAPPQATFITAAICGVVVGVLFACLASLL
jgi:hypothetical protein